MAILIGMDEAGYGPNLGPLVVAATAWEVAEDEQGAGSREQGASNAATGDGFSSSAAVLRSSSAAVCEVPGKMPGLHEVDLYRLLRPVVCKRASERRIAIADSKSLYHQGLGLRQLERGVHSVLMAMGESHRFWSALVERCRADPDGDHGRHCWPDGHDFALPVDASNDELSRLGARLDRACAVAGVRPLAVRARLVFPARFNELVADYGNKAAALSHVTVGLLREVTDVVSTARRAKGTGTNRHSPRELGAAIGASPHCSIYAVCDKHGGRNFYTSLLQHHFSEHWIQPAFESHRESHYEWGPPESPVRVTFRVNGETFLPTALASMTAKYLRELAMRAFNEFWCARVPGLRPTAGYFADARRFKSDISTAQRDLGIDDHVLWRSR